MPDTTTNVIIKPGLVRPYTAAADLTSRAVVDLGDRLGIVNGDIANGATGNVAVAGIARIAKTTGTAWVQNDKIYWDASTSKGTKTVLDNAYFGRCVEAAGSSDTVGLIELQHFTAEGAREITLAATGNQILGKYNFANGAALEVKVPNTGALSVTFPLMSTVPNGMPVLINKTAADAAAITIAANASDTLVGSTGTVDAANDRVLLFTKSGGPIVVATVIA